MCALLQVQGLSKAFGAQQLFSDVQFSVEPGERIGLIGPNGSGKSTLLKILCSLEHPDSGGFTLQRGARIGYLAQEDNFDEGKSLYANLVRAGQDEASSGRITETELYTRVHTLLSRAEFDDPEQMVARLSGGWRKRLALCRALLSAPDLLVLDEPTNHLDIAGILWLEKLLTANWPDSPAACILVSHDRRFLESTVNRVVELSAVYPQGSLQVQGTYADFVEKRAEYLLQRQQLEERLANKMRRETEWLRRGPKARTTKAKYRIDAAGRLLEELGELQSRNRALGQAGLRFDGTERKTKKLLEAQGLAKSFGERQLFSGVDILLTPGLRLGLVGNNGCGKSTLMRILAASVENEPEIRSDHGSIRLADDIRLVSFDQRREQLDTNQTLRRALAPDGDSVLYQNRSVHVAGWAKRFLFRPDQLETPVSRLSGGEQARILLARLMQRPADILLLDEPTNDLDIPALDVLEESLSEFPGAVVLVTHDRYLLDRLCTHILGFDGLGQTAYFADCDQWLEWLEEKQAEQAKQEQAAKEDATDRTVQTAARPKPGKLSYMEQREYDQMEDQILAAEAELTEVQARMADPVIVADAAGLEECWQRQQKLSSAIETMYQRWSELEERKNG